MVGERLLHRQAEAALQPLNALDDPLDIEVEVGERPVELSQPAVDVILAEGLGARSPGAHLPHHITLDVKSVQV